jgi:ankyrin repeat protein
VNLGNVCGATALHYATSNGHENAVRRLLRRGANIEAKDA